MDESGTRGRLTITAVEHCPRAYGYGLVRAMHQKLHLEKLLLLLVAVGVHSGIPAERQHHVNNEVGILVTCHSCHFMTLGEDAGAGTRSLL